MCATCITDSARVLGLPIPPRRVPLDRPEVEEVKPGVWSCPAHPEEWLPRADRAPRCPACDRAQEAGDA